MTLIEAVKTIMDFKKNPDAESAYLWIRRQGTLDWALEISRDNRSFEMVPGTCDAWKAGPMDLLSQWELVSPDQFYRDQHNV